MFYGSPQPFSPADKKTGFGVAEGSPERVGESLGISLPRAGAACKFESEQQP
jgi:hypothetical protein